MVGRRARVVCRRCHSKKIRCDLQLTATPNGRCTTCVAADTTCEIRPSHKGRRRKKASEPLRASELPGQVTPVAEPGQTAVRLSEMGFLALFNRQDAAGHSPTALDDSSNDSAIDGISPALQQSNIEVYFEYFYAWCPVIDPEADDPRTATVESSLLRHALALLAGSARVLRDSDSIPQKHYMRARGLFYSAVGTDPIERIRAAMLFYWSSHGLPCTASLDSNSWWIGVTIRLALDIGLHREPRDEVPAVIASLRRRIWWTLYARERVTALCQGTPCTIDDDYCDVRPPQMDDFPQSRKREACLFVYWIPLCTIIGYVNKQLVLSRRNRVSLPTKEIASRLVGWLESLPPALRLPISSERTTSFDRDIHQLYLPYLATITIVYLSTSQRALPEASVAGVLAGACTARLFEDYLARGSIRFLPEHTSNYIAVAILALMHVRPLDFLNINTHAAAHIRLLRTALKDMAVYWPSAKILNARFDKWLSDSEPRASIDGSDSNARDSPPISSPISTSNVPSSLNDLCAGDGVLWPAFFPFATVRTSPLVGAILIECKTSFPELWPAADLADHFNEFLETVGDISEDWLQTPFH